MYASSIRSPFRVRIRRSLKQLLHREGALRYCNALTSSTKSGRQIRCSHLQILLSSHLWLAQQTTADDRQRRSLSLALVQATHPRKTANSKQQTDNTDKQHGSLEIPNRGSAWPAGPGTRHQILRPTSASAQQKQHGRSRARAASLSQVGGRGRGRRNGSGAVRLAPGSRKAPRALARPPGLGGRGRPGGQLRGSGTAEVSA